jgi:hypothetical protein
MKLKRPRANAPPSRIEKTLHFVQLGMDALFVLLEWDAEEPGDNISRQMDRFRRNVNRLEASAATGKPFVLIRNPPRPLDSSKVLASHTLTVPAWHPCRVDQFLGRWSREHRKKGVDRQVIGTALKEEAIPPATGKRRVSLTLTLGPKQRAGDPDAYWKSLLDALDHVGLLTDNSGQGVELGPVAFVRGPARATTIVLEDLAGD